MTDAAAAPPALPTGRITAWVWGGILLIASAVLQLALNGSGASGEILTGIFWLGSLAFAAAVLLFAVGWHGHGSVVARRAPGMVAMAVLALWPMVAAIVMPLLDPVGDSLTSLIVWGYIDTVVYAVAALATVVAIGRARVVPAPWRWAPAWALAIVAGAFLLMQLVGLAAGVLGQQILAPLFWLLSTATVLAPLLLGLLALVLGLAPRPAVAVQVYPPAAYPTAPRSAPGSAPAPARPAAAAPGDPATAEPPRNPASPGGAPAAPADPAG